MHRLPRVALVLTLLVTVSAGAARAAASADSVRVARLADAMARYDAFGCSGQLLVSEHGAVVAERACGWADRRFHVAMTPGSQLAVGSVTKSVVAAAVLRLRAQGRLRLDDPLARHLPDVPSDKTAISLEQLLSHTAGLPRAIPDGLDDASRDEVVRAVLAHPLESPPGARFAYSDAGFDLLAAVIERVAGVPFDAFARRELLAPAGLERSGLAGAPGLRVTEPACGYERGARMPAWREWPEGWSGTGSGRLVTTARELARWADALRGGRAIGADGWSDMTTRRADAGAGVGYGLGLWLRERSDGARVVVIGGEVPGYRAVCRLEPEDERVVVVIANDDPRGDGRERQVVADALARLARGADAPLPPPVAPFAPGSARALEGVWALDGGGRVELWEQDGRLRLGAAGQNALDRLAPDDSVAAARRREAARRTLALVRAVVQQDSLAARAEFSAAELAIGFPLLTRRLRGLLAAFGDLQRVEGLGAVDVAGGAATRCRVRLTFLEREVDVALGFADGALREVGEVEEPALPLTLPVAPLAAGGYAAYDVAADRLTRLQVESGAEGGATLVLVTPAGERRASRVR
jgi:CubicO group peptidase (beta-lactamase class C family)